MDFFITKFGERNYRKVAALIVVIISIGMVLFYLMTNNKNDTFLAATIYALFLFVVSIYLSHMRYMILSRLYDRIEIYQNLLKINAFFTLCVDEITEDYASIDRGIISFKTLSKRSESMKEDKNPAYYKELGFVFNRKELEIEDRFLEYEASLSKKVTEIINKYIDENSIELSCNHFHIHSVLSFCPEEWCKEYLQNYKIDGRKMVNYIYKELDDIQIDFSNLELLCVGLINFYKQCQKKTKRNVKWLERLYGRELQYIIMQQAEYRDNYEYMYKAIGQMEEQIATYIYEHDDKIECYLKDMESFEERIIDKIDKHDANIESLLERLG